MTADFTPPPPPPPSGAPGYPATLTVDDVDRVANWRPLVHWLLVIPHVILSWAISYAAQFVSIVSWFVIVFTGRLPEGLANFSTVSIRYSMRTSAFAGFLHEEYPPFEFSGAPSDPGGHPVRLDVVPELDDRNRLTVGLRFLWAIPAIFMTAIIGFVAGICWFVSFFAVLFTGRWPEGLRAWVVRGLRATARLNAYVLLLTDEYPPLGFD